MNSDIILIPVYKVRPSANELRSIRKCVEVFRERHTIALVCPYGMDLRNYPYMPSIEFSQRYFASLSAYSHLLCSKEFYRTFWEREYMLIYQPDCWVFDDKLTDFEYMLYDYIGAPWYGVKNVCNGQKIAEGTVGNGGMSLRNVRRFFELAEETPSGCHPEDLYWAIDKADKLNIAPVEVACLFCLEHHPERAHAADLIRPMGAHKPWQLGYYESFWRKMGVPEFIND